MKRNRILAATFAAVALLGAACANRTPGLESDGRIGGAFKLDTGTLAGKIGPEAEVKLPSLALGSAGFAVADPIHGGAPAVAPEAARAAVVTDKAGTAECGPNGCIVPAPAAATSPPITVNVPPAKDPPSAAEIAAALAPLVRPATAAPVTAAPAGDSSPDPGGSSFWRWALLVFVLVLAAVAAIAFPKYLRRAFAWIGSLFQGNPPTPPAAPPAAPKSPAGT